MDKSKFIIISVDVVPEIYLKVLEAKELLSSGQFDGVSDAVKEVGISRSTYYKYCDHVFSLAEGAMGKKVTVSLLLSHESGVLSNFLGLLSTSNCNVLTISQDSPINGAANASITFDISTLSTPFEALIENLRSARGVKKLNIVAIE